MVTSDTPDGMRLEMAGTRFLVEEVEFKDGGRAEIQIATHEVTTVCPSCDGTGGEPPNTCGRCHGGGVIEFDTGIKVEVNEDGEIIEPGRADIEVAKVAQGISA